MSVQFENVLKMLLIYIVYIALAECCRERRLPSNLLTMTFESLDNILRRYYAEARTKKGEEYSRSSRNAIERHLAANGREVKITKNPLFAKSNKMLECKLKLNRREGKENVKHKPVIQKEDMEKLKRSPFLSFNDPAGLLRRVWFIITLFWCRRGCESQGQLRRDSFRFMRDAEGQEYAEMVHSVQTKNHQGGISEKNSHESLTRLYSTGEIGDSYWCLSKYVQKLNPQQQAFFQRPSSKAKESDMIWYENSPLGVNALATMMKEISLGAGLSQKYTNHSVRATAITLWSNANVPSRHIMSISGHTNEQSISSYNSRPSVNQLKNCSNILSNALVSKQASTAVVPVTPASSSISYSATNAGAMAFPNGFFHGCTIANANVYVLPQSHYNSA